MTSASKDFSFMFRMKFTTKCKFRIFPNSNINGMAPICKLIYGTTLYNNAVLKQQQITDLTNFQICHPCSKFCDCSTGFMAKQHWSLYDKVTNSTMSQIMNIRSTNTNRMNCNLHLYKHVHCSTDIKRKTSNKINNYLYSLISIFLNAKTNTGMCELVKLTQKITEWKWFKFQHSKLQT